MGVGESIGKGLAPLAKAPDAAGGGLRHLLELAIDGVGPLPGAKQAAARSLERKGEVEAAIDHVITTHAGLAGAQGFATNVGGFATVLITLPTNIAGLAIIQGRMLAGIAHLRGYNLDDSRVRTALIMCLLGEEVEKLIEQHKLPSTPMAVATAPVFNPELDAQVSKLVFGALLAQSGTTKLGLFATKRIPLLGGGVGAIADGWSTHQIGQYAKRALTTRRALRQR